MQPPEVFYKKSDLKNVTNSQENTHARVSFLIKLQALACNFNKKETLAQVFSCEFCEISKEYLFCRTTLDDCFYSIKILKINYKYLQNAVINQITV